MKKELGKERRGRMEKEVGNNWKWKMKKKRENNGVVISKVEKEIEKEKKK